MNQTESDMPREKSGTFYMHTHKYTHTLFCSNCGNLSSVLLLCLNILIGKIAFPSNYIYEKPSVSKQHPFFGLMNSLSPSLMHSLWMVGTLSLQ